MTDLRLISPQDIDLVCRHREEMFRQAGKSAENLVAMAGPFHRWIEPRLADGRYFGFVAEKANMPIGGVGLMEIEWPPHPAHPMEDRRGYVLNVFVEPIHRSQGVARLLMKASDDEFIRRGIGYAILHATAAGAPLYERSGWARTSEMAKPLIP